MAIKRPKSNFINMVLALVLVTVVSSASLGLVFDVTKDRIAAAKEAKKLRAIVAVTVDGYDNDLAKGSFALSSKGLKRPLEFYPAKKEQQLLSTAVKSYSPQGFSGDIVVMVGVLPDGAIHQVKVVEQRETPGLGTKIESNRFLKQFVGKALGSFNFKVKKDGGEVDAITAATISSRAFTAAVELALTKYRDHTQQALNKESQQ
jgi:Na+-translocating ferredoxin:NAD+ oxidoreductase subunit G